MDIPSKSAAVRHIDEQSSDELGKALHRKLFIKRMERKLELKKLQRNPRRHSLVQ